MKKSMFIGVLPGCLFAAGVLYYQLWMPLNKMGKITCLAAESRYDFEYYDYIIVMDDNNIRNLSYMFSNKELKKVKKLLSFAGKNRDISDPWWTGEFDITYDDVLEGCHALLKHIIKENKLYDYIY